MAQEESRIEQAWKRAIASVASARRKVQDDEEDLSRSREYLRQAEEERDYWANAVDLEYKATKGR